MAKTRLNKFALPGSCDGTIIGSASIVNSHINSTAAIAYSALSLAGSIANSDLAGSIAYSNLSIAGAIANSDLAGSIAYTKLSIAGSIANSDLAGSIAYSNLLLAGAIANSDLAGSIAYTKLSIAGSIANSDLAGSIAYSNLLLAGAIANSDLAGSIAYSKLSLSGQIQSSDLAAGVGGASFTVDSPSGTVNGTNKVFTFGSTPSGYLAFPWIDSFRLQRVGAATDNTADETYYMASTGATVFTVGIAPTTGSLLEAWIFTA